MYESYIGQSQKTPKNDRLNKLEKCLVVELVIEQNTMAFLVFNRGNGALLTTGEIQT